MKMVFTLILICLFAYSSGQSDTIKIGDINFKTISSSNNLIIYQALCENRPDHLFASQFVIRYDSVMQIGHLASYNYADNFYCRGHIDQTVMEQIKTSLSERSDVHNRIGILFSTEDKDKKFIAILLLFKKEKFKKFAKKANELVSRNYAGEKILIHEYNYERYAKAFILTETGHKLSLISVHS